jgi:DNA polymerase
MPTHEWAAWQLDQMINRQGLPIDLPFARAALQIDNEHRQRMQARAKELMGNVNVLSQAQLHDWLKVASVEVDRLDKAGIAQLCAGDIPPHVHEILEIHVALNMKSTAKLQAVIDATDDDHRLRGAFKFHGARTGRWSGALFQPHNLARGNIAPQYLATARAVVATGDYAFAAAMYPRVAELLTSCIRTVIAAPPGMQLVVADYASVETVVLAWATECQGMLNVFRTGRDAYREMASRVFGVDYDSVTDEQRAYAKPIVLGCGYGMGAAGMVSYATGFGVTMSEAEAAQSVAVYRQGYPEIVSFWQRLDSAARHVMSHPGKRARVGKFVFRCGGEFLLLQLPSGRALAYFQPTLRSGGRYGDEITYMGYDEKRKWTRISTHPGKLCENLIQSIARDLLVAAIFNAAEDDQIRVVGHIHDEILALADEDDDGALDRLRGHMCRMPAWASDMPLSAMGWTGPFYRKG